MSVFGGLMLTNSGRNLEAKAQLGKTLKFKRIALGDGQITTESMITMTSLINEVLSVEIIGMQITKDNIVTITFYLTNQDLEKGFVWRELGVIAEDPDTKEEILYNYGNARANAEYISGANEQDILELKVSIDLIISNVENVTVSIDNSLVFATKQELNELNNAKVDKIEGKGLSTNDYTNEEKTKLANLSNYDDTQINQEINKKADIPRRKTLTLLSSNWTLNTTTNKYEYIIEDSNITENDFPDCALSEEEKKKISDLDQFTENGRLILTTSKQVTENINMTVVLIRTIAESEVE